MALQFRRGTDAERQSITPKTGEPLYTTDTEKLYIGDGTTQGGILVTAVGLSENPAPSLSGSLDLAGNNIIGTGDINITGNIDATGYINAKGNINLGDGAEDNIIVGGVIGSSLIPDSDGLYDLGDNLSYWRDGYFEGLNVNGEITTNSISVNDIYSSDSSILYESLTQTFVGNLRGSILNDDSTSIIDATSSTITANLYIGDVGSDNGSILIDRSLNAVTSTNFIPENNLLDVFSNEVGVVAHNITSLEDNSILRLIHRAESTTLTDVTQSFGQIFFERLDINGFEATSFIRGGPRYLTFGAGNDFDEANLMENRLLLLEGNLGIGIAPLSGYKLEVNGSTIVYGDMEASAFKGSLFADDSTVIVDSIENTVTTNNVATDLLNLTVLGTEPTNPIDGAVAVADGVGWDPVTTGVQTMVVYLDGAWRQLASA